ncbi:hypothetical protein ACRALDRAFT_2089701, partial [Sodiomyces alcalophilus JCM 7366]|uniref:uncharacterized protein n=1 Tax=Sodiomyces alcalophilus JCM 7366 TaxID=591952 RepID=UPI0039B5BCF8
AKQRPRVPPQRNVVTSAGCYKSQGDWDKGSEIQYLSMGSCSDKCRAEEALVCATGNGLCFCGDTMPPEDDLVDDSNCNHPCDGFGEEACGGIENGLFWSVYNNGFELRVPHEDPKESSTSKSTATATSTANSGPGSSSTGTSASASPSASGGAQDDDEDDDGGPNIVGIAVGVSVGAAVILSLLGFGFWFMRRRRNQSIEEEHRRNAAVNSFIAGAKPPGSSGGISMTDSRMDPVLAHRRLSDGSIADNQDYSRKILRV